VKQGPRLPVVFAFSVPDRRAIWPQSHYVQSGRPPRRGL